MIHVILSFLAFLIAARTEKLRDVAAIYLCINVVFAILAGNPADYGQSWWFLCSAAEASIILWIWDIKHDAVKWIIGCSLYNIAVHLLAWASYTVSAFDVFYDLWGELIRIGEWSQLAAIVTFSTPVFSRLSAWYHDRQLQKGKSRWLARSTQAG